MRKQAKSEGCVRQPRGNMVQDGTKDMRMPKEVPYEVLKVLGRGAFGTVVRARDKRTGSLVAIKRVRLSSSFDADEGKLLLREMKLLRHFRAHENIVSLHDVFESTANKRDLSDVFFVTNLMDTDLSTVIKSAQDISNEHVRYFVYQVLRGLKFLHSAGVMHRDLKPQNLLVDRNCDLRICDLGLARLSREFEQCDHTVYVVTRWYRAPELLLGKRDYDKSIDLWSVGCIFAELLGRQEIPAGGRNFATFPGENYVHSLQLIVQAVGCPALEDQEHISQKAKTFLAGPRFDQSAVKKDWHQAYPNASGDALDLLDGLLHFNPKVLSLPCKFCLEGVCSLISHHTTRMHTQKLGV